jgi:hypothetical protein
MLNWPVQQIYSFSSENLIGVGSFGSVFKVKILINNSLVIVAVKVLNLLQHGAPQSFADFEMCQAS